MGACGVVFGYAFFYGGNTISPKNIDVQVISSSVIDGASLATFQIIIDNRNQTPLQLADLSVTYHPIYTRDPNDQTKSFTHET